MADYRCPSCGVYRGPHQNDCPTGGIEARERYRVEAEESERRQERRITNAIQGRKRDD